MGVIDELTFQKTVDFETVFSVWKANEGSDPVWQQFAKEKKGWNSWEDWRRFQMNLYPLEGREWSLYSIDDPNAFLSAVRVGPYQGFQQHFDVPHVHTFADLVCIAPDWVLANVGVQHRMKSFPGETQFIGLYIKRDNTILLIEGHHRAAAIAMHAAQGTPLRFGTPPTIALAIIKGNELPMLDTVLNTPSNIPI